MFEYKGHIIYLRTLSWDENDPEAIRNIKKPPDAEYEPNPINIGDHDYDPLIKYGDS